MQATVSEISKELKISTHQTGGYINAFNIRKVEEIKGKIYYNKEEAIKAITDYIYSATTPNPMGKWITIEKAVQKYNLLNIDAFNKIIENKDVRTYNIKDIIAYNRLDVQKAIAKSMYKISHLPKILNTYIYHINLILTEKKIPITLISGGRFIDELYYGVVVKALEEKRELKRQRKSKVNSTYNKKKKKSNQIKIKHPFSVKGKVLTVYENKTFLFQDTTGLGAIDCSFLPRTTVPTIEEIKKITKITGGYLNLNQTIQGSKYLKMYYLLSWE